MEKLLIKESELKKGDILLYTFINPPEFIPPSKDKTLKELISDNLKVLIDKLIIWTEKSNTTHAALFYDFIKNDDGSIDGQVAEATLPYCQLRTPILAPNLTVSVHRLPNNLDGSLVLNELPPLSETNNDNNGYALAQACVAGLIMLLRTRINPESEEGKKILPLILSFLKILSFPIGKYVDSILPFNKDGKKPFFCSQLVAYCYDMTAVKYKNPEFTVKSPSSSKLGNTLLDYLINHIDLDAKDELLTSPQDQLFSQIDIDSPELFYAASKIVDEKSTGLFLAANTESPVYKTALSQANDIKSVGPHIKKLIKNILILLGKKADIDKEGLAKTIIDFQTSFIMPSDLENVFEYKGEVVNA